MIPDGISESNTDNVSPELTPLESLNSRRYISGPVGSAGAFITHIYSTSYRTTNRWWIHFETGIIACVPTTKQLLAPREVSIALCDAFRRSIIIDYKTDIWKVMDCAWIMQIAEESKIAPGEDMDLLRELLADEYMVEHNGARFAVDAARVFAAERARLKASHLNEPDAHLGVIAGEYLYLYAPALLRAWNTVYSSAPSQIELGSLLRQSGFKATTPCPVTYAVGNGATEEYRTSIRMWRKRNGTEKAIIEPS